MDGGLISEAVRDGIMVAGVLGGFALLRKWLTKDLRIMKSVAFRLLRSQRVQSKALEVIAECQKTGKCNGSTDEAIASIRNDRNSIANWLRAVLLGQKPPEEDPEEE